MPEKSPATENLIVSPGTRERTVRTADGNELDVPKEWELLAPGDSTLTRRVKKEGPTWTVQERKGRRTFSKGVWAPADRIGRIRLDLEVERETEGYQKKRASEKARRDRKQQEYIAEFRSAVIAFLDFAPCYASQAQELAERVVEHATPVGSGTVARTTRIPVERRAESAVIAWLRHQTTAYDDMKIARVKGKRREVRRILAEESRRLLNRFRRGEPIDPKACPLTVALNGQ